MTARTDISINWAVSPRIITVLSPSVTITVQDLLDTCREAEDQPENMTYAALASAGGKEDLGDGVRVGITLTLLNAVLAFEARGGPTYVQCRVAGGNLVAVDGAGTTISAIYPTAFTQVLATASSSATIIAAGAADIAAIATAVWEEPKASHTTAGTLGNDLATKKDVIVSGIVFK